MYEKFKALMIVVTCTLIANTSFAASSNLKTVTAETGKIGKSHHHHNPASKNLKVHVPLGAEIIAVKAYMANQPWGRGESEYQPTAFTELPIVGLNGQAYAEWSGGWAYAELKQIGTTPGSQFYSVSFYSWKHDNSRKGKLEVTYKK